MKKIIWVFGQSATGKKTLINKLLKHDEKTLSELNLDCQKISACQNTVNDDVLIRTTTNHILDYDDRNMQPDNEYFNQEIAKNRRNCIMSDSFDFLENDNDILLIKGQDNDIWPGRGDIVKYFLENFANREDVEIEVYILLVENEQIWRKRIEQKEWFQKFPNKVSVMKNMLRDRASRIHEIRVMEAFKNYNVAISFIESLEESYRFISSNKILNRR